MPSIAPLLAGWQRRLGGHAGPLGPVSGGSGESPSGQPVQVELLVDGLWVDITSFVMTRDGSGKVSITRGVPNEGAQTEPSTCRLQLNNRDGRFSPRNPMSPYYGKIGRNTQLRVSVPNGNEKSYRFWGEVSAWPQRWDTTGTDVWVDLEAAGILRRLGQGATPLHSPMYRDVTNPSRVNVVAYWPCEDADGATSIASALSGAPSMAVYGSVDLASYVGWEASEPLPSMTSGSFFGDVPQYNVTGQTAFRAFVRVPDSGLTATRTVFGVITTGSTQSWFVRVVSNTSLIVQAYDRSGTLVVSQGMFYGPAIYGRRLVIQLELVESGTDIRWRLAIFDVALSMISLTYVIVYDFTLSSNTVGAVSQVRLAPDQDCEGTVLGHAVLSNATASLAGTGPSMIAYAGEDPGTRLARLTGEESISYDVVTDFAFNVAGNDVRLGPQRTGTLLNLIQDVVFADSRFLYEPTRVLGLGTRPRTSLYSRDPALTLSYASGALAEVPTPVDDDQHTRNDVTVQRVGGSSARAALSSGALSTSPPPVGVGRYDESVTVNIEKDTGLADQAGWRLRLGTVDEARYPTISVNLAHPTFQASTTLRSQALGVRPGDRIAITDIPGWLPPDAISQLAVGYSESIDHFEHRITWNCVPQAPYRVAFVESAPYDRVDTDGSVIAADVSTSATSLLVTTTAGQSWTTADVPFDIRVAGEVITVTAVSGASSPQTFTCTRSVNGVVKAQNAGAAVQVSQDAVISL